MLNAVKLTLTVIVAFAGLGYAEVSIHKKTVENKEVYVLENKYIRLTVNPSAGGRGESLIYKRTGEELTYTAGRIESPQGSGLFIDRFWEKNIQLRDFEHSRYNAEIIESSSKAASLKLTVEKHGLRIEKTVSLQADRGSIEVSYAVANIGDKDISGRFWAANAIYPKKASVMHYSYPYGKFSEVEFDSEAVSQITGISFKQGAKSANNFVTPVRGWAGTVSESGTGAAFTVEYPLLESFYSYHPPAGLPPTFEWLYGFINIRPLAEGIKEAANRPEKKDPLDDYIFRTRWQMIPVSGMDKITGAADGIVCSIVPGETGVKTFLLSDRDAEITAVLYRRRLPGEKKELSSRMEFKAAAGIAEHFSAAVSYPEKGTYVYTLEITAKGDGREIACFEVPYIHKESSAAYTQAPAEGKSSLFPMPLQGTTLGTDIPEPCIEWAKPLAKPIKAIIIYSQSDDREVAELIRRVDMEPALIEIRLKTVWKDNRSPYNQDEIAEKLLAENYDVIIIAGAVNWNIIPANLRDRIMEKVSAGTGFVYVLPPQYDNTLDGKLQEILKGVPPETGAPFLSSGIPSPAVPGMEKYNPFSDIYQLCSHGKGRIIFLRYNPVPYGYAWRASRAFTPAIDDDSVYEFPYWEYYYSLAARAVLFAAHREPEIAISRLEYAKDTKSFLLETVNNTGRPADAEISVELRNRRWDESGRISKTVRIAAGSQTLALSGKDILRTELAGTYFFNVFLKDRGKVLNWSSGSFEFAAPVVIKTAEFDKIKHSPEEPVKGKIILAGADAGNLAGYYLRYTITDANGRLLYERAKPLSGKDVNVTFNEHVNIPPLSTLCSLNIELFSKDWTIVDFMKLDFTVKRDIFDDLKIMVWGRDHGQTWAGRLAMKNLRRIGIDWFTCQTITVAKEGEVASLARNTLSAGMEMLPMEMSRLYVRSHLMDGVIRRPCLTDPAYLEKLRDDVHRCVGFAKDFMPPAYFIGDENSIGYYNDAHDFCQSPTCLVEFRSYLKNKYGSIDGLNRSWQSSFNAFEEVVPYTRKQAEDSKNYAPWAEHRLFMFSVLSDTVGKIRGFIRDIDPEGGIAVSGADKTGINGGFDWYLMLRHLDYAVGYTEDSLVDVMRSFCKEDAVLGSWTGYTSSPEAIKNTLWREMFNGFFNFGYFAEKFWSEGYKHLLSAGDGKVAPGGKDLKKILDEMRESGLSKTIKEAMRYESPVAILYSSPSLIATAFTGSYSALNTSVFNANANGWSLLIRDMGIQPPTYISSQQLEAGMLTPEKYPVFILPLSQALSEKEMEVLTSYVKDGGILVADAQAGILTENSAVRKDNLLNEVFGISAVNMSPARTGNPVYFKGEKQLPLSPVDAGVKVATGKALGAAEAGARTAPVNVGGLTVSARRQDKPAIPAFIVNRYGKGCGIYLNALLSEYPSMQKAGIADRSLADALRSTLNEAGFRYDVNAQLPVGTQMTRYVDGDNEYLALLRASGANKEDNSVSVELAAIRHVYELTGKEYYGNMQKIETVLLPGEVKIFALTASQRKPIQLEAAKTGEGFIEYSVSLPDDSGKGGSGIVCLEVYSGGEKKECYSRKLKVDKTYKGIVPVALNERNGTWEVKITDVITGGKDEKEIRF